MCFPKGEEKKKGRFQGIPNGFLSGIHCSLSLYCAFLQQPSVVLSVSFATWMEDQNMGILQNLPYGFSLLCHLTIARFIEIVFTAYGWLIKHIVICRSTAEICMTKNLCDQDVMAIPIVYGLTTWVSAWFMKWLSSWQPWEFLDANIHSCYQSQFAYEHCGLVYLYIYSPYHASVNWLSGHKVKYHVHWL